MPHFGCVLRGSLRSHLRMREVGASLGMREVGRAQGCVLRGSLRSHLRMREVGADIPHPEVPSPQGEPRRTHQSCRSESRRDALSRQSNRTSGRGRWAPTSLILRCDPEPVEGEPRRTHHPPTLLLPSPAVLHCPVDRTPTPLILRCERSEPRRTVESRIVAKRSIPGGSGPARPPMVNGSFPGPGKTCHLCNMDC
jgi:hypothetical protein